MVKEYGILNHLMSLFFRLEYQNAMKEWVALPLFRCGTLDANNVYRIVLLPRNIYFSIPNNRKFSVSCVEDMAAFSYWVGYAGYPFIDDLNEDRWKEGMQDRVGDKELP